MQLRALILATLLPLGSAGCDRDGSNPNSPGSPGTGNPAEAARPSASDTPAGGPAGVKGSLPHPGSSGGDAVPGATGTGTAGQAQSGQGLAGGVSASSVPSGSTTTQSAGAGPVPEGSENRSPRSAVGTR